MEGSCTIGSYQYKIRKRIFIYPWYSFMLSTLPCSTIYTAYLAALIIYRCIIYYIILYHIMLCYVIYEIFVITKPNLVYQIMTRFLSLDDSHSFYFVIFHKLNSVSTERVREICSTIELKSVFSPECYV